MNKAAKDKYTLYRSTRNGSSNYVNDSYVAEGTRSWVEKQHCADVQIHRGEVQYYVRYKGFIAAIAVWGRLLWLDRVPNPRYFDPPKRQSTIIYPVTTNAATTVA